MVSNWNLVFELLPWNLVISQVVLANRRFFVPSLLLRIGDDITMQNLYSQVSSIDLLIRAPRDPARARGPLINICVQ